MRGRSIASANVVMNNRPAVLIVDDDASLRTMLSLSLKRECAEPAPRAP